MENFDIFRDHLVYFVATCFIFWQFGIFWIICYISPFWYIVSRKNLATLLGQDLFHGLPRNLRRESVKQA
jgi:hypothetical protein